MFCFIGALFTFFLRFRDRLRSGRSGRDGFVGLGSFVASNASETPKVLKTSGSSKMLDGFLEDTEDPYDLEFSGVRNPKPKKPRNPETSLEASKARKPNPQIQP